MSIPKSWGILSSPKHHINSPSLRSEPNTYEKDEIDEQQDHKLIDYFTAKNESNQNKRFESDFTVEDQDKRNILHQTALRQDDRILEILIQDYETVQIEDTKQRKQREKDQQKKNPNVKASQELFDEEEVIIEKEWEEEDYKNDPEIRKKVLVYVRKEDHFHCTPIQICCFSNDSRFSNQRYSCLKILIENGSDVNSMNPNNRWGPLHWCAFYGDLKSVNLLLENQAHAFLCDKNGMYPLDLAGKSHHEHVTKLLVDKLVSFLIECQQFWSSELRKNEAEFIQYQEICTKYENEIQNPLLYSKILYWCCYYSINDKITIILKNLPRIYIMFPIKSLESQSCMHACCARNNEQALKMIIKFEILQLSSLGPPKKNSEAQALRENQREIYYHKIIFNDYLTTISNTDLPGIPYLIYTQSQKTYKHRYYNELKQYLTLENNYKKNLQELNLNLMTKKNQISTSRTEYQLIKSQFCKKVLLIDVKDEHGNTPLHLASLNGNQKIIKYLINKFANPEAENYEFFRARQLTRDSITQIYYDNLIKKSKHKSENEIDRELNQIKGIFQRHKKKQPRQQMLLEEKENLKSNIEQKHRAQKTHKKEQQKKKSDSDSQAGKKRATSKQKHEISHFQPCKSPEEMKTSMQKEKSKLINKKLKIASSKVIPMKSKAVNQLIEQQSKKYIGQLTYFSSQLFVPDIVLKINTVPKLSLLRMFKDQDMSNKINLIQLQINFQIALLQTAEFQIYMMKSFLSKDNIYIMLRLQEDKLEKLAQEMEIQIKRIDSYDLEEFSIENRNRFEPFRSSQRQKIVYDHLLNSINLGSLIKSEIIESCYPMHTSGGIQIVKNEWQKLAFLFIPQPFCQINDYLNEGKGRNFTSLTTMRLYFGESISFYFAWVSYLSCMQIFIAIPGLILQIYIGVDFQSDILPYWVIFVTIWATVQVELWKRKSSEINTRWGCIDQMLQAESSYYEGPIKAKFSGDEEINFITGKLTKHQQITKMAVYFVLFLIIIGVFLLGSFAIVYGIDQLKQQLKASKGFIFLLGALQAVAIQLLNLLFHYFSVWYAEQENHKFELTYEKSLIYKNVFFRFINSYMPLIYIIVSNNDYTLEDIFYFIIPLVLVKKAYYILIDFLVPALYIRLKIKKYFLNVLNAIRDIKENHNYESYLDEIEQFWATEESEKKDVSQQYLLLQSAARPVLKIESENIIEEQLIKGQHCALETKIDTDAIELNSLREDFRGTLDYYMEAITDYGYYVLFSAAFPIGPLIGIVLNVVDIQMKLYKLIYMSKRIKSERVAGIGEWLNVLEFLSVSGVITNFVLLYFKHKSATLRMFTSDSSAIESNNLDLWYFVSCVLAIQIIKILVRELIPDRPQWVIEEIDKINHRALVDQQMKTAKNLKEMEAKVANINQEIETTVKQSETIKVKAEYQIKQLDAETRELDSKFENLTKYKSIDKTTVITEYDMIVQSIFKMRFFQLDNALIIKRIQQFLETKTYFMSICQECGQKATIIECIDCQENFCAACFSQLHKLTQQTNHNVNLLTTPKRIQEQLALCVIKEPLKVVPYEESKMLKNKIAAAQPKRSWKKIEYFQLPLQLHSGQTKLNNIYDQFYQYYLSSAGFEYRDFSIALDKILPVQVILLDDESIRVEDKLFLNRIAFSIFKKKKNEIQLQQFMKICATLQNGTFEQKLIIFFDFIDINDDDNIVKEELENLFLTSLIQDFRTNKKVGEMIENFFPNNCLIRKKREIFLEFSNRVQRSDELKTFLECLLQVQT